MVFFVIAFLLSLILIWIVRKEWWQVERYLAYRNVDRLIWEKQRGRVLGFREELVRDIAEQRRAAQELLLLVQRIDEVTEAEPELRAVTATYVREGLLHMAEVLAANAEATSGAVLGVARKP
jgi:hypothetical protein